MGKVLVRIKASHENNDGTFKNGATEEIRTELANLIIFQFHLKTSGCFFSVSFSHFSEGVHGQDRITMAPSTPQNKLENHSQIHQKCVILGNWAIFRASNFEHSEKNLAPFSQ